LNIASYNDNFLLFSLQEILVKHIIPSFCYPY